MSIDTREGLAQRLETMADRTQMIAARCDGGGTKYMARDGTQQPINMGPLVERMVAEAADLRAAAAALRAPVERGEGERVASYEVIHADNGYWYVYEVRLSGECKDHQCITNPEARHGSAIEALQVALAAPPVPVEGERGAWLDEYERLKVAYVEATLSYNHEDNHAQGGVGSHSEVVTDTEVRATERALDAHINALAALPVQPDREHVGTSSDQVDARAALTRLYLAAHRAGVEAAAEVLSGTTKGWRTLVAARDTLAADARADTEDEWNWTDPGSPLAQALAALPVQGEPDNLCPHRAVEHLPGGLTRCVDCGAEGVRPGRPPLCRICKRPAPDATLCDPCAEEWDRRAEEEREERETGQLLKHGQGTCDYAHNRKSSDPAPAPQPEEG